MYFFAGELLHACGLSLPKIIFASHATLDKVQRVRDENKFIKKVFVFGDEFISKSYGSFNVFIRNAAVPSKNHFDCAPQSKMENVGIVFCSSGTTGSFPKAVQLTQNNLWFSLANHTLWVKLWIYRNRFDSLTKSYPIPTQIKWRNWLSIERNAVDTYFRLLITMSIRR